MKTTSKFVCLVLTLVMVMAMIVPSFAADGNDPAAGDTTTKGSITINNPVEGQTYKLYRMFDLESYVAPGEGSSGNEPFSYTVQKDSPWYNFISEGEGRKYFGTRTHSQDDRVYVVKTTTPDAASIAKDALAFIKTYTPTIDPDATLPDATADTAENKYKANDLQLGYYLLESSLGTVCSLDTTVPDVTINEKNQAPGIKKEVQEVDSLGNLGNWGPSNTAEIGKNINFRITVSAKVGAKNYVVHDAMDKGLTFNSSSVTVKYGETPLTGKPADGTTEYQYELITPATDDDTDKFQIKFEQSWLDTITTDANIVIEYNALLNASADITTTGNKNRTWLAYSDVADTKTEESATTTYTYSFDLVKTDSTDKVLNGAKFELYNVLNGGTKYSFVKATEADTGKTVYRKAVDGETGTTDIIDAGNVTIVGLDIGIYYLEETESPLGYNKLPTRKDVHITQEATLTATVTNGTWRNGGVQVINRSGTELPSTGGIGTTIFYVVGSILLVGAGVLLVVRRRMSMTKESD